MPEQARFAAPSRGGGRTWWAHFKFTLINIALTIHKNQFEEIFDLTFMSVFIEDYRFWRLRICLQKALKVSANLPMCRKWWAHLKVTGLESLNL